MKRILSLLAVVTLLTACNTTVDKPDSIIEEPAPEEQQQDSSAPTPEENNDVEVEVEVEAETETEVEAEEEPAEETQRFSESGVVRFDAGRSFIAFTGKKGDLVSHEGKFDFESGLVLNEENPSDLTQAELWVVIDITSMQTDSDGLTTHLLDPDFFESASFPMAAFKSTNIEIQSETEYTINGELTIKNVTQPISVSATVNDEGIAFTHTIMRTDYNVGPAPEGIKAIDNDVAIQAQFVFTDARLTDSDVASLQEKYSATLTQVGKAMTPKPEEDESEEDESEDDDMDDEQEDDKDEMEGDDEKEDEMENEEDNEEESMTSAEVMAKFQAMTEVDISSMNEEERMTLMTDVMAAAQEMDMPQKQAMDEPMPEMNTETAQVVEGNFEKGANYNISGSAKLITEGEIKTVRLENFSVEPGPALAVFLGDTNLGELKSFEGNQNYSVPEGVDGTEVRIHCVPFNVTFGVATLQ